MSKPGSGGVASAQDTARERRERLRALAVETADINNDPYFMKNHLGSYECRLCLTLHTNEGSYLAHTQGKRHQQNLARRAAKLANDSNALSLPTGHTNRRTQQQQRQQKKIGYPGYRVIKQRDPDNGQLSLLFSLHYPHILNGYQPRHRFMSTYEQRQESKNTKIQYLLFAAEPYNVIAFKIPNIEIDRREGKIISHWEAGDKNIFLLQIAFLNHNNTTILSTSTSTVTAGSANNNDNMKVTIEEEETDWDDFD